MAVIKINRSSSRLQAPVTPSLDAAKIDINTALVFGNALASFGKAVEKGVQATKVQQDKNDFRKLELAAGIQIEQAKSKYRFSSNVEDANLFLEDINIKNFKTLLQGQNKQVVNLFNNHLQNETGKAFASVYGSMLKQHGLASETRLLDTIISLDKQEASDNPIDRKEARAKKILMLNDPNNLAALGPLKVQQLAKDSDLRTKKFQLQFQTKTDPVSVLKIGKKALTEDLGSPIAAQLVLDSANTAIVSDYFKGVKQDEKLDKADKLQKVSNFAYMLNQLKTDSQSVSLDNVNDLFKVGQINSAQRTSLYRAISGEIDIESDDNTLALINGALQIADTVGEIDDLKNMIFLDHEVVDNLAVGDLEKFIGIFEKYDQDAEGYKLFKHNRNLLEIDLGVLPKQMFSMTGPDKKDQRVIAETLKYYDNLVVQGIEPNDAYIKTVDEKLTKNIPTIQRSFAVSSVSFPTADLTPEKDGKKGEKYFDNRRSELMKKYTDKEIDMETFIKDVDLLDSSEDLFKVRLDYFGDPAAALSDKNIKKKKKVKLGT